MDDVKERKFSSVELFEKLRRERAARAQMPVGGERFCVPRGELDNVDTILYRPQNVVEGDLPVLFNLHGGAWVAGDAILMDSFCTLLAEEIPALVVNVNYKKLDVHPFPYPQIELCDTVLYFAEHAEKYGIDKTKFAIGGHSAGAHIAAGAAIRLKELGFELVCQMLVYPFTDFTMEPEGKEAQMLAAMKPMFFRDYGETHRWLSPLQATNAELSGIAPAIFIVCGKDSLKPHGVEYAKRLIEAAVPVKFKEYPEALHGFLEVNRREYEGDDRRSPEQLGMTLDCEKYLINEIKAYLR